MSSRVSTRVEVLRVVVHQELLGGVELHRQCFHELVQDDDMKKRRRKYRIVKLLVLAINYQGLEKVLTV